jgi:phosphohistidine phosphatase SixA
MTVPSKWAARKRIRISIDAADAGGYAPKGTFGLSACTAAESAHEPGHEIMRINFSALGKPLMLEIREFARNKPRGLLRRGLQSAPLDRGGGPSGAGSIPSLAIPGTKEVTRMSPKRLLLMRHAEKPHDPGDPSLSPAGRARAQQLVTFVPARFGTPDVIIAARTSMESCRPVETVTPLAAHLGLSVEANIPDKKYADLAAALCSDPAYTDKFVVICWHHGGLPRLGGLLGMSGIPDPWPSELFDVIYFKGDHAAATEAITEPF